MRIQTVYFDTSIQYEVDDLSSVQLIMWHSANCILYILLSHRLWILYHQHCTKYYLILILISLILINVSLYMITAILFPKHANFFTNDDILYHEFLMSCYCLDIIITLILIFNFNKYFLRQIINESEMPYKGTLTSLLLNESDRNSVATLVSVQTTQGTQGTTNSGGMAQETIQGTHGSSNATVVTLQTNDDQSHHTSAASTAEATISYKLPPLSLQVGDSVKPENGRKSYYHRDSKYSEDWSGIVAKHTVMTVIMMVSTLICVIMFICVYYVGHGLEDKSKQFVIYEIWFFMIHIDCSVKSVGMYLNINMTNNDKEYRKCCSKCDKCCKSMCIKFGKRYTRIKYDYNSSSNNSNRNSKSGRGVRETKDNTTMQMTQHSGNSDLYDNDAQADYQKM